MAETVSNDNPNPAFLKARHARLERKIEEESKRFRRDDALITQLKKRKLRIRDLLAGHIEAPQQKQAA